MKSVECGSADVSRCSAMSAVSSDGNETLQNAIQVNGDETTFKRLETVNFDHLQPIVDNLPDDLTDNERVRAIDLLHRYADVFGSMISILGIQILWSQRLTVMFKNRSQRQCVGKPESIWMQLIIEPYRTKHDQVRILRFLTFCHFWILFSIADVSVVAFRENFDFKR